MSNKLNLSTKYKLWLAGIIDCDGTITLDKSHKGRRRYYYTIVKVVNLNEALIRKIYSVTKIGSCFQQRNDASLPTRHKKIWVWKVEGKKANLLLRQIKPYLIVKKGRAEELLNITERKK